MVKFQTPTAPQLGIDILRKASLLDCWLYPSLSTQPLSIFILSEAKVLDCWLFTSPPAQPLSYCLPERSEGPGLLAVEHCTMSTLCINTKGKILRFAQDDSVGGLFLHFAQDDSVGWLLLRFAQDESVGGLFLHFAQDNSAG